jgi:NADH-quinone oxidoreductase subunit E
MFMSNSFMSGNVSPGPVFGPVPVTWKEPMDQLIQLGAVAERPKAPKAEDLELRFSEQAIAELEEIKSHYPNAKAAMLPGLWIAQREYGGELSPAAIAETAFRLGQPYTDAEGVATFYSMYNVHHKPGRHKIEVCTCLCCHVNGAYRLRDWVKANLGVSHGETTADGMFTYEEVECLNACDRAPVIQVADSYHGPLTESEFAALLEKLRQEPSSSVVQLADEIVKVHIPQNLPTAAEPTGATKTKKTKAQQDQAKAE